MSSLMKIERLIKK